jgi:Cytochrome c7 and related cytochrome c
VEKRFGSCAVIRGIAVLLPLAILSGCVQQPNVPAYTNRAADPYAARRWSSPAFTTAHATFGDAAKHFLSIKPKPLQPIDFPHKIHTFDEVGIECHECHSGVRTGPRAGIPSINVCMSCHEDIGDAKDARIQTLRDYAKRKEEIPWQRVYGFLEEAHVRFNHSPHIRAGVECATCHGDVTQMTVAQRTVDHTMGFCITCHQQKGASNDCLTCHY